MGAAQILLYDFPGSICCQMARLVLAEKGVAHDRQTVDIMSAEQFEPWYTALNPAAVVPTLAIGEDIVTDTIRIVQRVDKGFDGPDLTPADAGNAAAMAQMMADVMALRYGILLYSRSLEPDRTSPTIIARGDFLRELLLRHPERAEMLERRIAGNESMQRVLADGKQTERHEAEARALVARINQGLAGRDFICGKRYSLADAFATAALARFRMHGFESWWSGGEAAEVAEYYRRMKARPSWAAAGVVDTPA